MKTASAEGELAGDTACLDSWRPYITVGPARQSLACPTACHDAPGRVDGIISTVVRSLSRSQCLRPSDSTQSSASFPASPSSCWLRLPSLGEPALPSSSRAYLAGAPPWSTVSWPGLCGPPFILVLVLNDLLSHAGARPKLLSPGL